MLTPITGTPTHSTRELELGAEDPRGLFGLPQETGSTEVSTAKSAQTTNNFEVYFAPPPPGTPTLAQALTPQSEPPSHTAKVAVVAQNCTSAP